METKIILILVPVIVITVLFLLSLFLNRKQTILRIDVDDDNNDIELNKRPNLIWMPSKVIKPEHGKCVSTKQFQILIVSGTALKQRGINDGATVLISPIKEDVPFRQQVKLEDVILTYDKETLNYDLSILQNYNKDKGLVTYSYMSDGSKQRKQKILNMQDVVGVAKYILNQNNQNSEQ